MAKKKVSVEMVSYGQYEKWDRNSKKLPKLIHITEEVEAKLDIEFGYILKIKGAKGKTISFRIEHPPFKGNNGQVEPDFTGSYFIDSNNYDFYLGDCIWAPIDDKIGKWTLTTSIDNTIVAKKTITLTHSGDISSVFFDELGELDW